MNDVILRLVSRRRRPLGCGLPVLSDDLHHVELNRWRGGWCTSAATALVFLGGLH